MSGASPPTVSASGVPLVVTERGFFTAPSFSAQGLLNTLVARPLDATTRKVQTQREAIAGSGGSQGGIVKLPEDWNAREAATASKLFDGTNFLTIAQELVDVVEEATELLATRREQERRDLDKLETECRATETQVRADLSEVREVHTDVVAVRLRDLESKITAASAATMGVRAEMAAASNRAARVRADVELVEVLVACVRIDPLKFDERLQGLAQSHSEARNSTIAAWRARRGASAGSTTVNGMHFFVRPGGSIPTGPTLEESRAVQDGLPALFVQRTQIAAAIDQLQKLVPLARALRSNAVELGEVNDDVDDIDDAADGVRILEGPMAGVENIFAYKQWLLTQLQLDCAALMEAFCAMYDGTDDVQAPGAEGDDDTVSVSGVSAATSGMRSRFRQKPVGDVVEAAEKHRVLLLNTNYARLLSAALEATCRLITKLSGGSVKLVEEAYRGHVLELARKALRQRLSLTPAPPLATDVPTDVTNDAAAQARVAELAAAPTAMSVMPQNEREIREAFFFFINSFWRDMALMDVMLGSGQIAVRGEVLKTLLDRVVCAFCNGILQGTESRLRVVVEHEKKCTQRALRQFGFRYVDAALFHMSTIAVIIGHCGPFATALQNKYPELRLPVRTALQSVFDVAEGYALRGDELKVFSRQLESLRVSHLRDFVIPEAPDVYDLRNAHEVMAQEAFTAADRSVQRARTICAPHHVGGVVLTVAAALQSFLLAFIGEELRKVLDALQREAYYWARNPAAPRRKPAELDEFYANVPTNQPVHAGMRVFVWGVTVAGKLHRFCIRTVDPLFVQFPERQAEWAATRAEQLANVDAVGVELLTFCAGAIVTKSLAVLAFEQTNRNEYKRGDAVSVLTGVARRDNLDDTVAVPMLSSTGTVAVNRFCVYLGAQLREADGVLRLCRAADQKPFSSGPSSSPAAVSGGGGGGAAGAAASLAGKGAAFRFMLRNMDTMTQAPLSFARAVGVGLYRGLVAHIKSFVVTDSGVLVMKRDVTLFREAVEPLIKYAGPADAEIITECFESLKELMSLLMVPLDNIRSVKATGLLQHMHRDDIMDFLNMRADLGDALRMLNREGW